MPRAVRRPTHSGSWYEGKEELLQEQINQWMDGASDDGDHPRAIIGPHAGYRYCGHVMAYAYRSIDASKVSRVFLLGPSHHVYTKKCLLSPALKYDTPLGSMEIDQEVYRSLKATGEFDTMTLDVDEAEHSLELHVPFIVAAMRSRPFKLVPIMVGALSTDSEARYGALLGPYLDDPANLFVISSDFCHWGSRFNYVYYNAAQGPIWKSIKWLDETGMSIIEKGDPVEFAQYLSQYRNTICGRHPIAVMLNMLHHCRTKFTVKFTQYDQSSHCQTHSDSSVSYAAAVVRPAV